MYLAHYLRLARKPPERQMYDTMSQHDYWPYMANDVYTTVRQCLSCRKDAVQTRNQCKLQSFPPAVPLEFVVMELLGPLPRTVDESLIYPPIFKFDEIVTDGKAQICENCDHFSRPLVHVVRIPIKFFKTDNRSQLVSEFFTALCCFLDWKN